MLGFAGMLSVSASANTISISGQVGEDYANLGFGIGTETTDLVVSDNWMHNGDGDDVTGLGLGLNIPLGPLMAIVDDKGVCTNPNDGDKGCAAAIGGGLQWPIGNSFRLFGKYYYSSDLLSSGINSYEETSTDARLTIIRPLNVEADYRYLSLAGKDGNRDNATANSPYAGANASF